MTEPVQTDPFVAAGRLAPQPKTREEATADGWARYYAAEAVATNAYLRQILNQDGPPKGDISFIVGVSVAATAVALALTTSREEIAEKLWDITPELGALNGEWEEEMIDLLDRLSVNPADIDPDLDPADFDSPSQREEANRG